MIDAGRLPVRLRPWVADAVARHPAAVRLARDAGVPIAVGTDSGTTEQHGTGREEMAALLAAGLSPEEMLIAATVTGARLLASARNRFASNSDRAEASLSSSSFPSLSLLPLAGKIVDGARADAVLLRRDPRTEAALRDPALVAGVLLGGVLVPGAGTAKDRDPEPSADPGARRDPGTRRDPDPDPHPNLEPEPRPWATQNPAQ